MLHRCLFLRGLGQLKSNLFDVIRMCALCGEENKLQELTVLVFAAGSLTWLYKHPALWADETAAKCPVVV